MHHLQEVALTSLEDKKFETEFEKDVYLGLSHDPKFLSSKYFYDTKGDEIFIEIMNMPSYYLTRAEYNIFETKKEEILRAFSPAGERFSMVELGAGDGYKTKVILKHFVEHDIDFSYLPVDISGNVLKLLQKTMKQAVPGLSMQLLEGDYFHMLSEVVSTSEQRNVVMFLGGNIGNFSKRSAIDFITRIRKNIREGDLLMVGFDLKKDPARILDAYNDKDGITASFNMNLLERINRELGANFHKDQFQHSPCYNPETGECRSYILSLKDQTVDIEALGQSFRFEKWEAIFTEVSKKYSATEMNTLVEACGFERVVELSDVNNDFMDTIWKAV